MHTVAISSTFELPNMIAHLDGVLSISLQAPSCTCQILYVYVRRKKTLNIILCSFYVQNYQKNLDQWTAEMVRRLH